MKKGRHRDSMEAQSRGRGAWRDENGELVWNLGDRLLGPGPDQFVMLEEDGEGQSAYQVRPRVRAFDQVLPDLTPADGAFLLGQFEAWPWDERAAGVLAAGWTVLAPFGGYLSRPPHIWLTGMSPEVLTAVVEYLVAPLLGGVWDWVPTEASAADMRERLAGDSLPVLLEKPKGDASQWSAKVAIASESTRRSMIVFYAPTFDVGRAEDTFKVTVCRLQSPDALDQTAKQVDKLLARKDTEWGTFGIAQ